MGVTPALRQRLQRKLTPGKKKRLGAFTVTSFLLDHPGGSYAYRIQHNGHTLIYASDASYYNLAPERMKVYHDFYRDADVLIFDAFFALIESFENSDGATALPSSALTCPPCGGQTPCPLSSRPLSDDRRLKDLLESTLNHLAPDTSCEVLITHEGMELTS